METKARQSHLTGMFKDRNSFENAYKHTLDKGYQPNDINILMTNETKRKYFSDNPHLENVEVVKGTKAAEGLAIGGAVGGTVVGVAAAIAAIGTAVAIPGLGIIVAGPLAAGLAGAGAGSIAGGLVGTLIGLGIPEELVKEYEAGLKSGRIVMDVRSKSEKDAEALANDWKKYDVDKPIF